MEPEKPGDQGLLVVGQVLVVGLENGPEFLKLCLLDFLHHVVPILGEVEKRATLARRAKLVNVVKIFVEKGGENLLWTERSHVLLLSNAEELSYLAEDLRCIVDKLKLGHFRSLLATRAITLADPIVFPAALLLELPVGKPLAWLKLGVVVKRPPDSYKDVQDVIKIYILKPDKATTLPELVVYASCRGLLTPRENVPFKRTLHLLDLLEILFSVLHQNFTSKGLQFLFLTGQLL